tara:strand:+ start:40 stop:708 length:669 start_codon:yes stop_codon:yes gene_type:complete
MYFTHKKWGLLTGYSIILMALVAGFVYGHVHASIYIVDNSDLTARLLQENIDLYKWGIVSWILIFLLDLIVSIGIYIIYKDDLKLLALLSSTLRVIYTIILGIAVAQLIIPLINYSEVSKSILYFESFEQIWSLGLIIFGIHLLSLGVMCFKSDLTPKFFGIFLGFGGLCYILVHNLKSFFPYLGEATLTIESILVAPMALSELSFALWLIVKFSRLKISVK